MMIAEVAMAGVMVQLDDELEAILDREEEPIERVALEMIVLELYRRGTISSGKAAELLGVPRYDFIQRASALGIPYFTVTSEELDAELDVMRLQRR
jgi:predicted HTH domain antitoxin